MSNYDYEDHFKLADSDDFYGFETPNEIPVSLPEKIGYTIVGIAFAYFMYDALTYIFTNIIIK